METLISKVEVVEFSNIDATFNPSRLKGLWVVEFKVFNDILGYDFWQLLLEDKIDRSTTQEWNDTTEYSTGQVIFYKGRYRQAIQASPAGTIPSTKGIWVDADKFENDKYQELWTSCLGQYLSLSVLMTDFPFVSSKISEEGAVSFNGTTYKKEDKDSVKSLELAIAAKRKLTFEVMDAWMNKNNGDNDFDKYLGIDDNSGDNSKEQISANAADFYFRIG